jgi:leader peptidase (prepilin peptidase)/N-methyltransferase
VTALTPLAVWAAGTGLLGLAIGSFLNVVIYRVPAGVSIVRPSSHCPACRHQIRNRHNLPVLGWLSLRGKCADCAAPISARYPLVELGTGVLFVLVTLRVVHLHLAVALPAYLYFVAIGLALALIDLEHSRLPNVIVLPSYIVIAVLLTIASAVSRDWWALARAVISTVALFGFFYAIAFAYPAGMGFGDVKLAGIIGGLLGYLSWSALIVGAFAAFLLGAVFGTFLLVVGHRDRKVGIPFGPFMIVGALLALFSAGPIAHTYLHLVGRA